MTKKFISNSWRILLAVLVLGFGLTLSPQIVRAEGSGQTELDQPLLCYYSGRDVPIPTFYVDILTAGEVINVSLDTGSFSIFDPAGNLEVEDQAGGQVAASAAFDAPITTAYKFTTDEVGTWKVVLGRYREDNNCEYNRFDISVTPSTAVDPDPRVAAGRVYNYHWAFNAGSFAEDAATDADYYILVPGGRPNKDYVWRLDLNNFAGYVYELIANDLGVDAPNSGYSVPNDGNSWTEKFAMYLGYPAIANETPTIPPVISNMRFVDDEGIDLTITPNTTDGDQDVGFFKFTSDVSGTYAITIDTNRDGQYAGGDRLLLGNVVVGENSVVWDGKGPDDATLAEGVYEAQVQVRMGEYHFLADDAETSGGTTADGLTICEAISAAEVTTDTLVYWDDETFLGGTTTLPDGELCSTSAARHTWGAFDVNIDDFGDKRYIDTYVYGLSSYAEADAIIAEDDTQIYPPNIDLDENDSSGSTDNDYHANFVPGGAIVKIADTDTVITDSDSTTATQVEIALTTWKVGDALTVTGALPAGISLSVDSTDLKIILTGTATLADYAAAIELIGFRNTEAAPDSTPRTITVRVKDDISYGQTAITTLYLDSDGDNIPDQEECPGGTCIDTDGDSTPDYLDDDDDDDGIPTADEDIDGDGDPTNDDTDGDGTPNYLDTDDDNDGTPTIDEDGNSNGDPTDDDADNDTIPDYLEPDNVDTDGDGNYNVNDPDDDGDGTPTADEDPNDNGTPLDDDTDGDGIPDYLDNDADNDGVTDMDEDLDGDGDPTNDDTDGDGTPNYLDTDDDNDGIPTVNEDGNTNGDPTDDDADNDTIPDYLEPNNVDTDGDGNYNVNDPDDDGDGVPTADEDANDNGTPLDDDTDEDGTPNYLDNDDDGDGIPTADEDIDSDGDPTNNDTDDDGIPNYLDPDDDGDGTPTIDEDNDSDNDPTNDDIDNDGTPDYLDNDSDNDGVLDDEEDRDGDGDLTNDDTDGDGIPDYLDTDDDNDGIPTIEEDGNANGDPTDDDFDNDGTPDYLDNDADNDGVSDNDEDLDGDGDPTNDDTDGDGTPDYLDTDDDDDGIPTINEDGNGNGDPTDDDADNDGTPDYLDNDTDNDGVSDVDEDLDGDGDPTNDDTDGDGIPNYLDTDDDDDGTPTTEEDGNTNGDPTDDDFDNDGIPDYLDDDADNDSIPDNNEDLDGDGDLGNDDTDGDGTPNYLDNDDDDDGILTIDEDGNGNDDPTDDDADNDTIPDYLEPDDVDTDGDGTYNVNDPDDDGDGVPTADEDANDNGTPLDDDSDNDGTPDYLDSDNLAPTVQDDHKIAGEGIPAEFAVLENDSDGDGDTLTIVAVELVQGETSVFPNSKVSIKGDMVVYTATQGYIGQDTIIYTVSDGTVTGTAKVYVDVWPVTDLELTQTYTREFGTLSLIVVAHNLGTRAADGALITDTLPAKIQNITWTCTAAGGASCNNISGTGNVFSETVGSFPGGSVVTYTIEGALSLLDSVTNDAYLSAPYGVWEEKLDNNHVNLYVGGRILLPLIYRNAPK